MDQQMPLDFARIAEAIEYIRANFKQQPSWEQVAREVGLSAAHFQHLFTAWAGVSPEKFLPYISIEYAKKVLKKTAQTRQLHELFIKIEGMTPGEYKNGGQQLSINYNFTPTPFGEMLVAETAKGICYMAFCTDTDTAFSLLQAKFPNARYHQTRDRMQQKALSALSQDWNHPNNVKLHLKGSSFQLKVWESLLKIPVGELTTYGAIAAQVNHPNASRAVGTAIGDNPVALLIPCHRVIRATGELGGYHWGLSRKVALIGWEAAQTNMQESIHGPE